MKIARTIPLGLFIVLLELTAKPEVAQAQPLKSVAYVTLSAGRVYVVGNNQTALLKQALALTPELTVATNGVIKISGDGEERLTEGRKLSLDGFWLGADETFLAFRPHYLMKDRVLFFVQTGLLTRVEQDVAFGNGNVLRTDGTLLTPDFRLIRLQDGQRLSVTGDTVPALDHVMIRDGKLVLQKDGSIIPLPADRTIGMSDGTKVTGTGLITRPTGEQIALSDGQRLTLDGAAMSKIQ